MRGPTTHEPIPSLPGRAPASLRSPVALLSSVLIHRSDHAQQ